MKLRLSNRIGLAWRLGACGAVLGASFCLAGSSALGAPTAPSLVGSWQGNGVATDSSGNADNGTLVGNAGYDNGSNAYDHGGYDARGVVPLAFSFDGTTGTEVDIPDTTSLAAPQTSGAGWSMSAWVKPTAAPTGDQLWIFGQNQGPQLVLYADPADSSLFVARWQLRGHSGIFEAAQSTATIPVGDWTLLTGTWDGATLNLYVNGTLSGTASPTADLPTAIDSGCDYFIGGVSETNPPGPLNCVFTGQFFTGLIDNVSYWSGVLSSAAIAALDRQTPGAGPTDLVTNGSFELPKVASTDSYDTKYPSASPGIPGWTVTGNSVDLIDGYWQPHGGAHSIDLDGNAPGGLSQTLATTPGQPYILSFAYSGNPDGAGTNRSMVVTWGGTPIGTYTWPSTASNSRSSMGWQTVSVPINGLSTTLSSTPLAFTSTDLSSAWGVALDDVSVTPTASVPSAPTAVSAVGGSAGQASVSFAQPFSNGGSAVSSYTVTASPGGVTATGTSSPILVSGLTDGTSYTFTVTATNVTGTGPPSMASSPVIPGADTWPSADPIVLSGSGTESGSATGSIDLSGQARWYKFSVQPGENLQVNLTNLPAGYDLSLFSDIGQAFSNLNTTSDLQQLSAEFSPSAFSPSAFSPSAFSPSAFSPSAFSPSAFSPSAFSPSAFSPSAFSPSAFSPSAFSPSAFSMFTDTNGSFESAQSRSLIAVSAGNGSADKQINANAWNNTGSFYIRVSGQNGAFNPGAPFTLKVQEDANSCSNVQPSAATLLTPAVPTGIKTLILADYERMPSTGLATMESKLTSFAARSEIAGSIVDVGSQSPQVTAEFTTADANPSCVYAENLVADSIQKIVAAYRAANPTTLKYIVIVGNDHAIPFFRYPDASGLGSESNYVPPVADNTPSQASLRLNYVLSQDAYGAQTTLHLNGLDVPVPNLPVGRLVETPAEISGMLDAYTLGTTNGVVPTPTSSLVTGYDFLASAANSIESDLSAGLGTGTGVTNDTLIAAEGTPPASSWTAANLSAQLLTKRHDLIFLGGHFSADNALAADFATTLNSTDLATSSVNLENSIVFSAGCHSGYNIVDGDAVPGVTQPLDWVQAFAQKQATVIAGTGYQYGDTDFIAYSARLYASFAHDLRVGTGPVGVGNALIAAKQQYLEATPDLTGIDVKSLLESTLYGLPMLSVNMPGARDTSSTTTAPAAMTAFTSDPGKGLGLSYVDKEYKPVLTPMTKSLNSGAVIATYLQGRDGIVTDPGEPTLPLLSDNVSEPNVVLRGVGFTGGTFTDQTGITALTGAPTTDVSAIHAPFVSSSFFPEKLWSVNYFSGLANGSTATQLMLTPAQYMSDTPGSTTDDQRAYTDVKLRLFYSGNITAAALAAPPSISRVNAVSDSSGNIIFSVNAVGDPAAGMEDVWITYETLSGAGAGVWQSVDLTQGATDSTLWTGMLSKPSGPIAFMVQAVDGVGLVSLDDNGGSFYQPNQIKPALQTAATQTPTALALVSPPSSALDGAQVPLTATVKTGGMAVTDGQTVTFRIGGASVTGVTVGGTATATLPLVDLPGNYTLTASFAGTTTLAGSSASVPFTIGTLPTALVLSGGGTVLDAADTGVSAKLTSNGTGLSQRTVEFVITPSGSGTPLIQTRITDQSGSAALGLLAQPLAGSYTVTAFFGPGGPTPPALPADPVYQPASTAAGVSLTVTVTGATLAQRTLQFVQTSAKYAALTPAQKQIVTALAQGAGQILAGIVPKLSPAAKARLETAYEAAVQSLLTQGWLTAAQAATLDTLVVRL